MAIEHEVLVWGVRLTTRPLTGTKASLVIKSEIATYKPGRGSDVRITFSGTVLANSLRLLDAQRWNEGMIAIISATRGIVADMKAEAKSGKSKKQR